MAKAGIFFITQDMVISQYRDAVIFLGIQAAHPRQPVANANLKPGLIQPIFELADNRVTQITRQGAKWRAAHGGGIIDWRIFPGNEILVTQRLMQIAKAILHPLLPLYRPQMAFIDKASRKAKIKLIVIRRRRYYRQNLPCPHVADAHHLIANLRPDIRIFGRLHITCRHTLLA